MNEATLEAEASEERDAQPCTLPSWRLARRCPARRESDQVVMTQTLRCSQLQNICKEMG